jgi:hypothetical protein
MSALLIWKGERDYLVAHRDIDLIVQGPTIPKAIARFYRVLALEVLERVQADGTLASWLGPPPPSVREEWEAAANKFVRSTYN